MNLHDDTQLYIHCRRGDTSIYCRGSALLYYGSRTLDVSQPSQAECGSDGIALGWIKRRSCFRWQQWTDTVSVTASEHVRLLGVTISSDLSVDKHVATVCSHCFYWLRRLQRVRRSLDDESMKTVVHAFVTSRVDYCNTVLVGAPKSVTDKLQSVVNATARSWYQEVRSRTFSTTAC